MTYNNIGKSAKNTLMVVTGGVKGKNLLHHEDAKT
jgi:hypothetical protein